MGFPEKMIGWISSCITTAMYSVKLNGSLEGYFCGKSGLRQGDPISPYLFVIAMEVLTSCLKKEVSNPLFKHHWRTNEVDLHHLISADDVFLFCKGEVDSVNLLFRGFHNFSKISGLCINLEKSVCFYGNVPGPIIS